MVSTSHRFAHRLALCIAACLPLCALAADGPAKPPPPEPARNPGTPAPKIRTLDDLKKLPPGAVIIICDDLKEGLRLVPKGILLTPDEYQKLLDQARSAPAPDKPATPSACRLTAHVNDNLVSLKAQFDFPTTRPNTLVTLGCAQGSPSAATLDGKTPLLQNSDDGWLVQVEKPGDHQATLELDVPLVPKGAERGFDLDLPHAAITSLDLDLPDPAIKEVRLALPTKDGRPASLTLPSRNADGKNRVSSLLGALGRLDLAWKGPPPPPTGAPLLTADGRITVRIGETSVLTDVVFTLKPQHGQTSQWRFLLPPQATLLTPRLPDERVVAFEQPDKDQPLLHVLRLKASTAEPLDIVLQIQQPRTGPALTVGPFAVLGAFPHQGTLLITAPPDLRLTPQVRGEPQVMLSPREVTDDERRREAPRTLAAFTYRTMLALETKGAQTPVPLPFLTLEVEPVQGTTATHTVHTLQLTERGWRVTTDIDVTPLKAGGVDHLECQVPPGYEDLRAMPRPNTGEYHLESDATSGTARVFLPARRTEPFRVTLEGLYPLPAADGAAGPPSPQGMLTLPLPQPRKTMDRGGQVTILLPRDMELLPPQPADPAWEGLPPGKTAWTLRSEHVLERLTISWRTPRPEVSADCIVDVTVTSQQVHVRQRFVLPIPAPPAPLLFWVPEGLAPEQLQLRSPETASAAPPLDNSVRPKKTGFRPWPLTLSTAVDREHPLVLEYAFPLPEPDPITRMRRFSLPLVLPELTGRVETRLRFWSEPGTRLTLTGGGPWEEVQELGDRDVLPSLCLRGRRPDLPPLLRLADTMTSPLAAVLVERALVQVTVGEPGEQTYRARLLFTQVQAPWLDVELPAPLTTLGFKALLEAAGTVREAPWQAVDENGQPAPVGRIARLPIPAEFSRKPLLLDLTYQVSPTRTVSSGLLQSTLCPPLLHSDVGRFPVGFQAHLPATWVPVYREGGLSLEQRWGWRGWLLAPRPASTSGDLERWLFSGYEGTFRRATAAADGVNDADPASVVCWRSNLAPLRLNHVPQQLWLLVCSAVLLLLGLTLHLLSFAVARRTGSTNSAHAGSAGNGPTPKRWWLQSLFWPLVAGVGVLLVLAGLFWPGILGAVLYGCQPGAMVLFAVLVVQWMWQQRYRRQVVFLPGFAHMKPGSSLVRRGSSNLAARPREPSTVDAPPPLSSNQ